MCPLKLGSQRVVPIQTLRSAWLCARCTPQLLLLATIAAPLLDAPHHARATLNPVREAVERLILVLERVGLAHGMRDHPHADELLSYDAAMSAIDAPAVLLQMADDLAADGDIGVAPKEVRSVFEKTRRLKRAQQRERARRRHLQRVRLHFRYSALAARAQQVAEGHAPAAQPVALRAITVGSGHSLRGPCVHAGRQSTAAITRWRRQRT